MGRFISADTLASTGQGILGNNMFAYCLNNPIAMNDSQGNSATIAGGICGGIFGLIGALISECSDDKQGGPEGVRWDKVWQCTASGAAAGAFAGFSADVAIASCGVVPAIFISAGGGAIASAINSAYTQNTLYNDIDGWKVASDALLGGFTNGLCTGTSDQFKPLVNGAKEGIKYAATQVYSEFSYGLNTFGNFMVNDFLPTLITGAGAWMGGLEYDYLT